MNSYQSKQLIKLLPAIVTLSLLSGLPQAEESTQLIEPTITLDTVLASVANTSAAEIPFKEQQANPMLESPLETAGVLIYDPLERSILKKITEPSPVSYFMNDKHVILNQNGKTRKISMKRSGELLAIFTSIRGVIEGSNEDIDAFFQTNFFSEGNVWNIELFPREKDLQERLEVIEIWGIDDQIDTIVTRSPNGSVQTMWLNQLHPSSVSETE